MLFVQTSMTSNSGQTCCWCAPLLTSCSLCVGHFAQCLQSVKTTHIPPVVNLGSYRGQGLILVMTKTLQDKFKTKQHDCAGEDVDQFMAEYKVCR